MARQLTVRCQMTTNDVLRFIKGLTCESDLENLALIRDAVDIATGKAQHDRENNRKALQDAVQKEIYGLMAEVWHYVREKKDVPNHIINEVCRLLYRVANNPIVPVGLLVPPIWARHYKYFDDACIEGFRMVRTYVNKPKVRQLFWGKAKWVKNMKKYRPIREPRMWAWFVNSFTAGINLYRIST